MKSPYIPIVIDNVYALAFLDTGAHISLLSADFLSSIPTSQRSPLEKSTIMASSVTGEPVDNIGTVVASIHLGNKATQHKFFVARNITHPVILGWDFITQQNASISSASFNMPGATIPFVDRQQYQAPLKCKVSLVGNAHISPMCETHVQGRLSSPQFDIIPQDYDGYFEPTTQDQVPVIGARSLFKPQDGLILIRLINPSNEAVNLPAETCLGQFFSVTGNSEEEFEIVSVTANTKTQPMDKSLTASLLPSSELSKEEYEKAEQLLQAYSDIFSASSHDIGQTDIIHHHINTSAETPVRQRAYRTSPAMRVEIQKQVDDLLQRGIIEESYSPWSSPIVMVKKKDDTFRFCVDYRKLNAVTVRDSHPIPRQDDSIDSLSSSTYFSVMDLSSGYWQVQLHPQDKDKTAFTTGTGLYQFTVMPFGLVNAPMTFQRLMEVVLHGLHWSKCLVYLDDCIVMGKNFDDHLKNLQEVLQRFQDAGLKLKPSKCNMFRKEVTYLGYVINTNGVKPDPSNIEKVKSWPQPRTPTQVRSFLGLASFYRRFIPSFSKVALPLTTLTHKGQQFIWTAECEMAFQHLKEALTNPPLLAYPDFDKEFILSTDASLEAVGAILSQIQNGKERVISYFSQTLTTSQKKWSTYDREFWAIVSSVRHFRHFLRYQHFSILTDHKPLLALQKFPIQDDASGRRTRWIVELNSYKFSLTHKKGKSHGNADALSRRPEDNEVTPKPTGHQLKPIVTYPKCNAVETRSQKSQPTCDKPAHKNSRIHLESPSSQPYRGVILTSDVDVQHEQQLDDDIRTVVRYINNGERPNKQQIRKHNPRIRRFLWEYSKLVLHNDVLYRKKKDNLGNSILQLVVPSSLVPRVLKELHGDPSSGHFGAHRTIQRAESMCYWPFMNKEITDFCNTCTACESFRLPNPKHQAPLQPISTTHPLEIVFADIAELPITRRGFRYILVVTDHFSKYVNIYPMKDQTAPTIAKHIFEEYVKEHGVPEILHTDQGRQFESRLVQELCNKLGIKKSRSTPYHPQGAGIVERCNRTIKDQLAKYISDQGGEWDTHINQLQLAYNTSTHSTTGLTPYFILHGREARIPANITCSPPPSSGSSLLEYTTNLAHRLKKAWEYTKQKTQRQQQQQKQHYDTRTRTVRYNTGDLVWLHDPTNSRNKLEPNWKGPFTITSSSDDGLNYDIVDTRDERFKRRVHHNRLKLHRSRAPRETAPPPPSPTPKSLPERTGELSTPLPPASPVAEGTKRKIHPQPPISHGPAYIMWSPRPPNHILHHEWPDHDQQPRSGLSVRQQIPEQSSGHVLHHRQSDQGQQPWSGLSVRQQTSGQSSGFQQPTNSDHQPRSDEPAPPLQQLDQTNHSNGSSLADQTRHGPSLPGHQPQHGPSSPGDQPQNRPSSPAGQPQPRRPHHLRQPSADEVQFRPHYHLRSSSAQYRQLGSPASADTSDLQPPTRAEQPATSTREHQQPINLQPTRTSSQQQQQQNDNEQLPGNHVSRNYQETHSRYGRRIKLPPNFKGYKF